MATNPNYWAKLVVEEYLRKELARAILAAQEDSEMGAKIVKLQEAIESLKAADVFRDRSFVSLQQAIGEFVEILEHRTQKAAHQSPYIPSTFPTLDARVKFGRGHFIVLGGRSGMGKSTVAVNLMHRMIVTGQKVGMFSLEMTRPEIVQMLIAIEAGVNYESMTDASKLNDDDFDKISEASRSLYNTDKKLEISDRGRMTIDDIREEMEHMRRKMMGLDVVFIDHMHIINTDNKKLGSMREKLIYVTAELKAMAKDFDCAVICLAQMNRDADKRDDKRPVVADLKESGSIEQDADTILFVYRDNYYLNPGERPKPKLSILRTAYDDDNSDHQAQAGTSELICRKNRHGTWQNFTVNFEVNPRTKRMSESREQP
jgi:replicative DNA helicase